jgi:hypothetical protein
MSYEPQFGKNIYAAITRVARRAWNGDSFRASNPPVIFAGEFILALNAAQNGTVNLIGLDVNNKVVFGDAALGGYAAVNLTAANLIAMFTTPVAILPAPGVGKALLITEILFQMTTTATAFTGGGPISFIYSGVSIANGAVHTGTIPAATVTAGAGTSNTLVTSPGPATPTNGLVVPANTGINITNATGAFAAGIGTAKVQIWYATVTL